MPVHVNTYNLTRNPQIQLSFLSLCHHLRGAFQLLMEWIKSNVICPFFPKSSLIFLMINLQLTSTCSWQEILKRSNMPRLLRASVSPWYHKERQGSCSSLTVQLLYFVLHCCHLQESSSSCCKSGLTFFLKMGCVLTCSLL